MRYYKCIKEIPNSLKYLTLHKIYSENMRGNYRIDDLGWKTIETFVKGNTKYFEEVTQEEYIKSINLKEKLIELANTEQYSIIINSREDAIALDKIYFLLGHISYRKPKTHNESYFLDNVKGHIGFQLRNCPITQKEERIDIKIKDLLNYI